MGLNHKTAPVAVRERVAVSGAELAATLAELRRLPGVTEVALLSTCNRSEVYAVSAEAEAVAPHVAAWFVQRGQGALAEGHLYRWQGPAAARHLFRVAAGLDSLVLGEPQVLGQVRDAFLLAQGAGTVGPVLSQLFRQALELGKRVRAETGLGEGAASVSYAAVVLARRIFGSLDGRQVLLIGAGKMGELALKNLLSQGAGMVWVANRTAERADALAARLGGRPLPLEAVPAFLEQVDIVLSSVAAPHPVITREQVRLALRRRRGRPLFFIDIAVPRSIEPAVHQLDGAFLYNVDDLEAVVAESLRQRAEHVAAAESLVEQGVAAFAAWLQSRRAGPVIARLRERAEAVRRQEVERLLRRLPGLSEAERALIQAMSQTLVNKLLHPPTVRVKERLEQGDGEAYLNALAELFDLGPVEPPAEPAPPARGEEAPARPEGRRSARPALPPGNGVAAEGSA